MVQSELIHSNSSSVGGAKVVLFEILDTAHITPLSLTQPANQIPAVKVIALASRSPP
ncbi:MAG: hypothetical protein ACREPR_03925 [Brasilonema sp.]